MFQDTFYWTGTDTLRGQLLTRMDSRDQRWGLCYDLIIIIIGASFQFWLGHECGKEIFLKLDPTNTLNLLEFSWANEGKLFATRVGFASLERLVPVSNLLLSVLNDIGEIFIRTKDERPRQTLKFVRCLWRRKFSPQKCKAVPTGVSQEVRGGVFAA